MSVGPQSRALLVAAAAVVAACANYRHDTIVHNVIATGWDAQGSVVSLAEALHMRWDPVGFSLHRRPRRLVERQGQFVRPARPSGR